MKHGICLLSVVPGRAEANDKSEMVTQLLFGEMVKILNTNEKWLKVQTFADGYTAWVDKQQIQLISEDVFQKLSKSPNHFVEDILTPVLSVSENQYLPILLGSRIYGLNKDKTLSTIGKKTFKIDTHLRSWPKKTSRNKLVEDAFLYLNSPYLWGGKTPFGIDCSGFTQMVYSLNGIQLPRDAYQQAELGHALSFIEEAEEGDLAFFDNKEGKIVHVGIMLKNHRIIHASGKVRVDRIDHQGIFRNESNDYSHKLRIIKKIF